jgi:uncharacterized damage-inducible protein DinB
VDRRLRGAAHRRQGARALALDPRFLADELRKAFAADPWYGPSTSSLLRGLTPELATARPAGEAHGIWELVLHMTGWQRETLRRLRGGEAAIPAEGDWPEVGEATPVRWQKACFALATSLDELARAVEMLTPIQLATRVGALDNHNLPLGTGVSVAEMVSGILQHNAYHSGQIALLRKALGV